jgi:hypothetical protein
MSSLAIADLATAQRYMHLSPAATETRFSCWICGSTLRVRVELILDTRIDENGK